MDLQHKIPGDLLVIYCDLMGLWMELHTEQIGFWTIKNAGFKWF